MDNIPKIHELNPVHHHQQMDGCQNKEIRNLNNFIQSEESKQQNGKWNQFVSSKLPIKSLKSPSRQQNNNKNILEPFHGENPIILTHNQNYNNKVSESSTKKATRGCPDEENDDRIGEPGNDLDTPVDNDDNKINSSPGNTSWNRIFQCFGVFKPRKISSNLNSTFTTTNLFGQAKSNKAKGKESSGDLLQLPQPQLRRTMTDLDIYLQELADGSEILSRTDAKNLGSHFPPRSVGNCWEKTFSSTQDGFSLHNLYRKLDGIDSPMLFVIEDIEGRVFGAVLSCAFKVSENFYGNSDTFLFRCRPEFEVFKWSGDNLYFIQGQDGFISVGSDDGRYGLWLDDNMYNGRTEKCSTFNSPALVPEKDFKIKTVECWSVAIV